MPKKRTKRIPKSVAATAAIPLAEAKARVLAVMHKRYRSYMREPRAYPDTTWSATRLGEDTGLPTSRVSAALKSLEREGLTKYLGSTRVQREQRSGGGALSRLESLWVLTPGGKPAKPVEVSLEEVLELDGPVIEGEIYDADGHHVAHVADAANQGYVWKVTTAEDLAVFRAKVSKAPPVPYRGRRKNPTENPAPGNAELVNKLKF